MSYLFIVPVNTIEESREVQEFFFSNGIKWNSGTNEFLPLPHNFPGGIALFSSGGMVANTISHLRGMGPDFDNVKIVPIQELKELDFDFLRWKLGIIKNKEWISYVVVHDEKNIFHIFYIQYRDLPPREIIVRISEIYGLPKKNFLWIGGDKYHAFTEK